MADIGSVLLSLIIILAAAKIGGEVAERFHQPAVLGELIFGVLIGPSLLGWVREDEIIYVFAQLGVILLLFEVGLETNIRDFLRVGLTSLLVAAVGVIAPFVLGYLIVGWLGIGGSNVHMIAIYMGATLTATSVGITARVLADMRKVNTDEARIVLSAAVIDDVIGLIILAVVLHMVRTGNISIAGIIKPTVYSVVFLILSLVLGLRVSPRIFDFIERNVRVRGALWTSFFLLCLVLAVMAERIGLSAIVGAFAAGVILAQSKHHEFIMNRVTSHADIFVGIFFVTMGIIVDVKTLLQPDILILAAVIVGVAIIGKIISGLGALGKKVKKIAIGIGMIPRGEVGLIFASLGLLNGVISPSIYSAIVVMVLVTTFITPPLLKLAMGRREKSAGGERLAFQSSEGETDKDLRPED